MSESLSICSTNSSSAQNFAAAQAFRSYFDYDAAIVTKENEGNAHFLEVIQDELRKGFPLYISGNQRSGASGHAWVADGFDRDGLIHMNFGWDGQATIRWQHSISPPLEQSLAGDR